MDQWTKVLILICLFGFLKEFRPIQPYLWEYIYKPWSGKKDSSQYLLLDRYSYIAQLLIVSLITDVYRQNFLLLVLGIAGIAVSALLVFGSTLTELIILQVLYGTFMATEVAYNTYMYNRSSPELFYRVTAYLKAALLSGRSISAVLGEQFLISGSYPDVIVLSYITLGTIIAATILSLLLPSAKSSTHLLRSENNAELGTALNLPKLYKIFVESYKNCYVLKLSVFWITSSAVFMQVERTFSDLINFQHHSYYYAIDVVFLTIPGFVTAMCASNYKIDFKNGDIVFILYGIITSGLIYALFIKSIIINYILIAIYSGIYYFMAVCVSAGIAKNMPINSYGLVFGFNTFVAIIMQTFLTLACSTYVIWSPMDSDIQYFIYGICHSAISFLFVVFIIASCFKSCGKPATGIIPE